MIQIPKTKKVDIVQNIFGKTINDPYQWLEDLTSDETLNWVKVQNSYSKSLLKKDKKALNIKKEISRYLKIKSISTPVNVQDYVFWMDRNANDKQP